jgi:hypothetical protein
MRMVIALETQGVCHGDGGNPKGEISAVVLGNGANHALSGRGMEPSHGRQEVKFLPVGQAPLPVARAKRRPRATAQTVQIASSPRLKAANPDTEAESHVVPA